MKNFPYLTRRGFVLGGAALAGTRPLWAADPACVLIAEQEEGPYYIDDQTLRQDVTEGRPGVPLRLRVALVDSRTCEPLQDAAVDIWHCDALGVYSGFTAQGGGGNGFPGDGPARGPGGRGRGGPNGRTRGGAQDETRFLRGVQLTDRHGMAEFASLYPGWYQGRTIHVHLKIHVGGTAAAKHSGGHVAHTGQLFFPEDITADVAGIAPYAAHSAVHRTLHSEDHVFQSQGGAQAMLKLARLQKGSDASGFLATATVAVDPAATPAVF